VSYLRNDGEGFQRQFIFVYLQGGIERDQGMAEEHRERPTPF